MTADASVAADPTTNRTTGTRAMRISPVLETWDTSSAAVLVAALHELELYADTEEACAGRVLAALLLDVQLCAPGARQ